MVKFFCELIDMDKSDQVKISKFLSFILRHKPDAIDLRLDNHGWANIEELITKANASDKLDTALCHEQIKEVISSNDKNRFLISNDETKIKANQGHSVKVELQLKELIPPEVLYHGTAQRFLNNIREEGLKPGKRHHVHLSENSEIALAVGQRYGKPVILKIQSFKMHEQDFKFFLSENGVWLTDLVPTEFIVFHS